MDLLDTTVNALVLAAIGLLLSLQMRRFERDVDRRFEQVDRRFEQVDRRFEQVDRRFEQIEVRLDAMRSDLTTVALSARGPSAEAQ
ncbi:MAG: hypothetical protein ACRDH9_10305 [Actinomycetota bacterium]